MVGSGCRLEDPQRPISPLLSVCKVYIQQLRRNTSLNQLAQAAALILDAQDQVHQMLLDWNRTDFEGIREQVSWITDCRRVDVAQISKGRTDTLSRGQMLTTRSLGHRIETVEIDIRQMLQPNVKLEQWTVWLDEVVTRFLDVVSSESWLDGRASLIDPFLQKTADHAKYVYSARQFLMRWNYYGSLAMRDLTLRSAPSFGL
jgi:hypothetical protein